jgi:hypothetical protein
MPQLVQADHRYPGRADAGLERVLHAVAIEVIAALVAEDEIAAQVPVELKQPLGELKHWRSPLLEGTLFLFLSPQDIMNLLYAKPFQYTMRHRFPKPPGV